jgi:hypothetical protein
LIFEDEIFLSDISFINDVNENYDYYMIEDKDGNEISIFIKSKHVVVSAKCKTHNFFVDMKGLIHSNGLTKNSLIFLSSIISDETLYMKENTFDYETFKLLYDEIPHFKLINTDHQDDIDIEKCYGRTIYFGEVGLSSSWLMYFNHIVLTEIPQFVDTVKKEINPFCIENNNNVIKIQLVEQTITDYSSRRLSKNEKIL